MTSGGLDDDAQVATDGMQYCGRASADVFAHGYATTAAAYSTLLDEFARSGVVVAAPELPGKRTACPGPPVTIWPCVLLRRDSRPPTDGPARARLCTVHLYDWARYLDQFHDIRAGVTESVLAACDDGGIDPYSWLAAAVPESGVCLDLACGSAPMEPLIAGSWIGVDLAASELACARARRGDAPLIRADATALPLRTGGCAGAVCVMALMTIPELESALAELVRVVRPGSKVAFLLPATRPLRSRDRLRYLRLLAALRRTGFSYPRPDVLQRPARFLTRAGFIVVADEARTFRYPMIDARTAETLVDSLYLPATVPGRVEVARRVTRCWVGSDIGIPLRRVVVTRDPA